MKNNKRGASYYNYKRVITREVAVGGVLFGEKNPIRVQSMTTTNTNDIADSVEQVKKILSAGGELVRLTAQGVKEAKSLAKIKDELLNEGITAPISADIHFNAKAAFEAALHVDKVRINPGNFSGEAKLFKQIKTNKEDSEEKHEEIREKLIPLIERCKEHHCALRIGVNHGSLSDRIMSEYGDTIEGMVQSCMEYLHICRSEEFHNIIISMKSSNTLTMVQAVRLLVDEMHRFGMLYPMHLGVTEAGDGEDGRIKSSVGIGALLMDGIGDTIRVSLSEPPECEIPVAQELVEYSATRKEFKIDEALLPPAEKASINRRMGTNKVSVIGGGQTPVVIASHMAVEKCEVKPDYVMSKDGEFAQRVGNGETLPVVHLEGKASQEGKPRLVKINSLSLLGKGKEGAIQVPASAIILLECKGPNIIGQARASIARLQSSAPVVLSVAYDDCDLSTFQLRASADLGVLLLDRNIDGVHLTASPATEPEEIIRTSFSILQAARQRTVKTEYISCPSCGRTLFDLPEVTAKVKAATAHLSHLKIGIMGCIVNGPGEMADADYGYVGSGVGKISIYRRQECRKRGIPQADAVDELIALIKKEGDWIEP